MSHGGIWDAVRGGCFPRVSGDEPAANKLSRDLYEFSPRERG